MAQGRHLKCPPLQATWVVDVSQDVLWEADA